jgi:hypothetical protein
MPDKSNGDIAADGYNKYKVKNSGCYHSCWFLLLWAGLDANFFAKWVL